MAVVVEDEERRAAEIEASVVVLDLREEMSEKRLRRLLLAFREFRVVGSDEGPRVVSGGGSCVGREQGGEAGDGFRELGRVARSLPSLPFRTLRARGDLRQDVRRRYISRAS